MAQSLANILVHLVFSTKRRRKVIASDIRPQLNAYLAGVLRQVGCPALAVGSVDDHAHMLYPLARTMSQSKVVEEVKKSSSKWLKKQGPRFAGFSWQNGYGAFSISPSHRRAVSEYIRNQEEHHAGESFEDEFRRLLRKYEVEYDERYVWD